MNTADLQQVSQHLQTCQTAFVPPLNERVDVTAYSARIRQNAETFEAWDDDRLIGLVAAYLRPENEHNTGFVTSVSVIHSYTGQGIAKQLMKQCERRAAELHLRGLRLEVAKANTAAIALYQSLAYTETNVAGITSIMALEIKNIT